jgi:predicted nuclease with RNAse H fold
MGYPTGALHRLLLLTGMRVNEAAQPAVVGVYDFHPYADEKREALELWAQHLAKITNPVPTAPAKVVKLARRRR